MGATASQVHTGIVSSTCNHQGRNTMKLQSILSAGLAATLAAFVVGVQAAPDTATAAEVNAPAAEAPAKATAKKVKPHSHMEEKGYAQAAPKDAAAKDTPAPDLTDKHLHPRDAK